VNRVWERIALALVVCVPVPALALSGLSLPLPSVVERIAAALVPFGDQSALPAGTTLTAGRIVRVAALEQEARSSASTAKRTQTGVASRATRNRTPVVVTSKPAPVATARAPVAKIAGGTTLEETVTTAVEPRSPTGSEAPAPAPAPAPPERKKEKEPTRTKEPAKTPDTALEPVSDTTDTASDTTPIPEPEKDTKPTDPKPAPAPEPGKPAPPKQRDSARDLSGGLGT
jgi:hypothetical protein